MPRVLTCPYAPGLLQAAAWSQGLRDGASGRVKTCLIGVSARVEFAYDQGFRRRRWHRSPNGQIKWEGK